MMTIQIERVRIKPSELRDFIRKSKAARTERVNKQRFKRHKHNANQRGIEFDLTYEQWRAIWGERLKYCGHGSNNFCMARYGDKGGYTVGNVRITTNAQNAAERVSARGERNNGGSKLTKDQVILMRGLYRKGSKEFNSVALGKRFGVCPVTVLRILYKRSWGWLN